MSTLRGELFHDEEARNWHYRVPALHINGGTTAVGAVTDWPDRGGLLSHPGR
jgi:hypothetical protein